jgi:GNAT superfamily N-acetyltransferase
MVLVREVTTDDWQTVREIRLTALAEAPSAFGSSYTREAAFTEEQWRGRINERSVTFFAYVDAGGGAGDVLAGLAGVFVEDGQADVVSMWVRPAARGHRVGEALVEAAAAWAKAHSHPALCLWVTETNGAARRLYERCGFTVTGDRQPLPSDSTLTEIRMRREL